MDTKMNEKVFDFFKKLTEIPHCSFKEEKIGDYLLGFAKERGLEAYRDKGNNVYIKKPSTNGKKESPVILQGHMDMVCVKEKGFDFDFEKDALQLFTEDGFLKAKGTSLGADNGIAVAMILAILDSDEVKHPGIEAIITTREEVGLLGAAEVEGERFEGKTLINIDSEEEGIFTVSCCGGVRHLIEIPIVFEKNSYKKAYKISVTGLKGGHSGMEINKQRANGIKIIARTLLKLDDYSLVKISGGEAMNAIAKDIDAVITTDKDITSKIAELEQEFKNEFQFTDENLKLSCKEVEIPESVITKESALKAVDLILALPFGVQRMSDTIEGLVETSTNLGVIETTGEYITLENSHRSSVETEKQELIDITDSICRLAGANSSTHGNYPGWEYVDNSVIRDLFVEEYKKQYKKDPVIGAIHAGLECGILQKQIGKLDMISIGPDMFDVHTPNEKLDIESTHRTFELLLNVLERL